MKVDVALFIQTLEVGGAQRVTVNLANGFAEAGYATDLVLVNATGGFLSEVSDEVRIVDLHASRTVTCLPDLYRYLRDVSPSTVLSAMTHTNVAALLTSGLAGNLSNVIVTEHGDFVKRYGFMDNGQKEKAVATLAGHLYPFAKCVVANSQTVKDGIVETTKVPADNIQVIPNPVVSDTMLNQRKRPVEPWFESLTEPIVISVGRLVPKKDYPTLLLASEDLRETHDANLVLIGDGQSRPSLESLTVKLGIEEYVTFPGTLQNPFPYLEAASVFALSSATEAFGNVLVEAMACGCPVIATRSSTGPIDILGDGEYGRLTGVGDEKEMAAALRDEIDDPTPESILRNRANDFSIDRILPRFESLLSSG